MKPETKTTLDCPFVRKYGVNTSCSWRWEIYESPDDFRPASQWFKYIFGPDVSETTFHIGLFENAQIEKTDEPHTFLVYAKDGLYATLRVSVDGAPSLEVIWSSEIVPFPGPENKYGKPRFLKRIQQAQKFTPLSPDEIPKSGPYR